MQAIALTCVANSHVISNTPGVITREVPNTFTVSLSNSAGGALDIAGITAWEFGIARGFLGQSTLLAFTTDITVVGSVLTITIDTATEEFSDFLAGKLTATVFATLRGYGAGGVSKAAYTFPMTATNVGYDDTTADTNVLNGLTYTKGVIDSKFANIADTVAEDPAFAALLTAKEAVANKTQEIDAVTPSADKYTSEAAVVAYVAGLIPDVPDDLSDLTDTTGILAGKVDVDGEKVLSDNNYTTAEKDKVATVNNATLETLSGADVTVAPWGRYRWSASGACSITTAGFAATGKEVAYLVITVGIQTTVSLPAGTVIDETRDVIDDAGVYEAYIAVIDNVTYFRVISRPEAA